MRVIDADELKKCVLKWLPQDPCGKEEKEMPFETDICVSMLMEIDEQPTIQPEPHWIPVTERLPEYSGRYLVSVLDGIDRRTTVAPYHPQSRTWSLTGRMAYWKIIAWMPLPEPYRGEDK